MALVGATTAATAVLEALEMPGVPLLEGIRRTARLTVPVTRLGSFPVGLTFDFRSGAPVDELDPRIHQATRLRVMRLLHRNREAAAARA